MLAKTDCLTFEFAREAGIQAGGCTASYERMEGIVPIISHDVREWKELMAGKRLIRPV